MQNPPAETEPELTQQEREGFWRRAGWNPEWTDQEKAKFEATWSDTSIEEAISRGF